MASSITYIYLIDPEGGYARTNDRKVANALIAAGFRECTKEAYRRMQAKVARRERQQFAPKKQVQR